MHLYAFHPDSFPEMSFTVLAESESDARLIANTVLEAARGKWLRELELEQHRYELPLYGLTPQKIANYIVASLTTPGPAESAVPQNVQPASPRAATPAKIADSVDFGRRRPRRRSMTQPLR